MARNGLAVLSIFAAFLPAALVALPLPARPDVADSQDAFPGSDGLTAHDIYERMLDNRFRSFIQETSMRSGDRRGRELETRLRMHWKDFTGDTVADASGVLSKALVQYTHPFDIRHSGYLVIHNRDRISDQFVYFPSRRQTVRVNLRGQSVFGTDFSFEDVIPRDLDHAQYGRQADQLLDGVPVFVVEAVPNDGIESEYSRFLVYIDQARWVLLRARYWDESGVEVKELLADPESLRSYHGVWVPTKVTMRHLLQGSYTTLSITSLVPNPDLPETTFEVRRLEAH